MPSMAAIAALRARGPLFIGGKSMGGRVASMIADERHAAGCLPRLPFHPVDKPTQLRTAHLPSQDADTDRQGCVSVRHTRRRGGYKLSKAIEVLWLEDGDHDLRPRKACRAFHGLIT